MNTRIIVTRVGDPDNPQIKPNGAPDAGIHQSDDGSEFRWFQLEVSQRRGIERVTAIRNFSDTDRFGIDREDAVAAMNEKQDLTDSGIEVLKVAIEPIETPFMDAEGNPVFQTEAIVIKLPSETVDTALSGTNKRYRRLGTVAKTDAPSVDEPSKEELADAAL